MSTKLLGRAAARPARRLEETGPKGLMMSIATKWKPMGAAFMAALFLLVASPAWAQTAQTPPPAQQGAQPAPTIASGAPVAETRDDYVLGANDRIRVIVFNEPALSGEFVVDGAGRVALPLIGETQAMGLTLRAFEDRIEAQLRRGYLNDPRVSIEVLNFRPFFILGEVVRPNSYPYTNNLSLLAAVATSGGFTPLADQTRAFVRRAGEEGETLVPITPEFVVQPGDTIRIPRGAFYILGEVNRPGEYPFSAGMTVYNAVAAAQGFTYRANQRRVWIQRQGAAESRPVPLTPSLRIEPGDTIRIGERFF